jgi:hypothetical protein
VHDDGGSLFFVFLFFCFVFASARVLQRPGYRRYDPELTLLGLVNNVSICKGERRRNQRSTSTLGILSLVLVIANLRVWALTHCHTSQNHLTRPKKPGASRDYTDLSDAQVSYWLAVRVVGRGYEGVERRLGSFMPW